MGLVIVVIVGALLGWLIAIVIDRHDRVGTSVCALAGAAGAVIAASLAGDVALLVGITPVQLMWSVIGAVLAIVLINMAGVVAARSDRERFDNPTGQRHHHRTRPLNKGKIA